MERNKIEDIYYELGSDQDYLEELKVINEKIDNFTLHEKSTLEDYDYIYNLKKRRAEIEVILYFLSSARSIIWKRNIF